MDIHIFISHQGKCDKGKCVRLRIRQVWDLILPFGISVTLGKLYKLSVYLINQTLFVGYSSGGSVISGRQFQK